MSDPSTLNVISIEMPHVYAFIGGTVVGRFLGIIPSILVGGILVHLADNTIFTVQNVEGWVTKGMNLVHGFK